MNDSDDENIPDRPRQGRGLPPGLSIMINGTLAGIGGVFLATASLPATGIAAATATAVALLYVIFRR